MFLFAIVAVRTFLDEYTSLDISSTLFPEFFKFVVIFVFGNLHPNFKGIYGNNKIVSDHFHYTSVSECTADTIPSRANYLSHKPSRMGERRNAYRILVGKPDGKRSLGRPRRRWMDNIKMDLREVGWDGRAWIDLAQDRDQWRGYVNAVMNLRVQ
jgi:hypothetical protein